MKVVTAAVPGGPEVMVIEERDTPAPGRGEPPDDFVEVDEGGAEAAA